MIASITALLLFFIGYMFAMNKASQTAQKLIIDQALNAATFMNGNILEFIPRQMGADNLVDYATKQMKAKSIVDKIDKITSKVDERINDGLRDIASKFQTMIGEDGKDVVTDQDGKVLPENILPILSTSDPRFCKMLKHLSDTYKYEGEGYLASTLNSGIQFPIECVKTLGLGAGV